MISCEHVSYEYPGTPPRIVVQDACATFPSSQLSLIKGPSGTGKSTLIALLAGLLRPTAGQVLVHDEPISRYTSHHRTLFRQALGLVTQRLHLFEELSAFDNVMLPVVPRHIDRSAHTKTTRNLLQELGLDPSDPRPVRLLSGGERQRVGIVRALAHSPKLVLMDEPTSHQDDERSRQIVALLQHAMTQGATVCVTAHDPRVDSAAPDALRFRLSEQRLVPIQSSTSIA